MFIFKLIRYAMEMQLVMFLALYCKLFNINKSSNQIGFIARKYGPKLGISKRANQNLKNALPNLSKEQRSEIIRGMWENLGRTAAEFFNIKTLIKERNRINIKGIEILRDNINNGAIYVSAHIANWEIIPIAIKETDKQVGAVFRESNNYFFNKWMIQQRKLITEHQFPKGPTGTKEILNFLKDNGSVAMLVDQKLSNGVKANFFGLNAMTASTPASLSLKYGYPVVPLKVKRKNGVNFEIEFFDKIEIDKTGNIDTDILNFTNKINLFLEKIISDKPEEWFWLHNRWDKRFN